MTGRHLFGRLENGEAVERLTIVGGGLTANIMTWGSVLQDLRLEGHEPALVLGFDHFEDYLAHSRYFGATAGRCANRIKHGQFQLSGRHHQLDRNFLDKHHLHGGSKGIGKRNWTLASHSKNRASLTIHCADGDMGYPGNIKITVTYTLLEHGVLDIRFDAESDGDTLCNLAHHSYFNLSDGATISNHDLQVFAEHYLPVDDEMIPTGEVTPVSGTKFDFRQSKPLSVLPDGEVLDHNFCLSDNRQSLRHVATLSSQRSGLNMQVHSTEPGLQVYDGAKLDVPVPGLDGLDMKAHAGIALEPQCWPDAINHSGWHQPVLRKGDRYHQHSRYVFSKDDSR